MSGGVIGSRSYAKLLGLVLAAVMVSPMLASVNVASQNQLVTLEVSHNLPFLLDPNSIELGLPNPCLGLPPGSLPDPFASQAEINSCRIFPWLTLPGSTLGPTVTNATNSTGQTAFQNINNITDELENVTGAPYVQEALQGTTPFSQSRALATCACGEGSNEGTVNFHSGEFVYDVNVYSYEPTAGPNVYFNLTYRSRNPFAHVPSAHDILNGDWPDSPGTYDPRIHGWKTWDFGRGWDSNMNRHMILLENQDVAFYPGNGRVDLFTWAAPDPVGGTTGTYIPPPGMYGKLTVWNGTRMELELPGGLTDTFRASASTQPLVPAANRTEWYHPYLLESRTDAAGNLAGGKIFPTGPNPDDIAYDGMGSSFWLTGSAADPFVPAGFRHDVFQNYAEDVKFCSWYNVTTEVDIAPCYDNEGLPLPSPQSNLVQREWIENVLLGTARAWGTDLKFVYENSSLGPRLVTIEELTGFGKARGFPQYRAVAAGPYEFAVRQLPGSWDEARADVFGWKPTLPLLKFAVDAENRNKTHRMAHEANHHFDSFGSNYGVNEYRGAVYSQRAGFHYGGNATLNGDPATLSRQLLQAVENGRGDPYLINSYDRHGRVETQTYGGGVSAYAYEIPLTLTSVVDGNGNREHWLFPIAADPVPGIRIEYLNRHIRADPTSAVGIGIPAIYICSTAPYQGQTGTGWVEVSGSAEIPCAGTCPPDSSSGTEGMAFCSGVFAELPLLDQAYATLFGHNRHYEEVHRLLPRGNIVSHLYDEANPDPRGQGNLLRSTQSVGFAATPISPEATKPVTTTYTYDAQFRLKTQTAPRGNDPGHVPSNGGASTGRYTTTYFYDYDEASQGDLNGDGDTTQAAGKLVRIEHPTVHAMGAPHDVLTGMDMQTAVETFQHDSAGRLLSSTDKLGLITTYERHIATGDWNAQDTADGGIRVIHQFTGTSQIDMNQTLDMLARASSMTGPKGETISLDYAAPCRVATIQLPGGPAWVNSDLDADGNQVEELVRDENGTLHEIDRIFDMLNRVTHETTSVRHLWDNAAQSEPVQRTVTTQYHFDHNGNLIAIDSPAGVQTILHDERDLVYQETEGGATREFLEHTDINFPLMGRTTTSHVDGNGNPFLVLDPRQLPTRFYYDAADRMIVELDAAGKQTDLVLDPDGNVVEKLEYGRLFPAGIAEPLYETTSGLPKTPALRALLESLALESTGSELLLLSHQKFSYDERGQNFRNDTRFFNPRSGLDYESGPLTEDDAWVTEIVAHDPGGNVVMHVDDNYAFTNSTYDRRGLLLEVIDDAGNRILTEYDDQGEVTSKTKRFEGGATMAWSYDRDEVGRIVNETSPDGKLMYHYDRAGNQKNRTGYLPALEQVYDSEGRVISETHGSTAALEFAYDPAGRIASRSDGNSRQTNYAYTALGDLFSEQYSDGGMKFFSYDAAGNLNWQQDPRGVITQFSYGPLNEVRTVNVTWSMGAPLITGTESQEFVYDGAGRLVGASDIGPTVTGSGPRWFTRQYDSMDNVILESQNGAKFSKAHDGEGRVRSITYPDGKQITYDRDGLGRSVQVSDVSGTLASMLYEAPGRESQRVLATGTVMNREFTPEGRPTSLVVGTPTNPGLLSKSYTYSTSGLMESATFADVDHWEFEYDPLDRLVKATEVPSYGGGGAPGVVEWDLDAVHNWNTVTENGATTTHSFDDAHAQLTDTGGGTTLGYDQVGNLVSTSDLDFYWDFDNRLVGVYDASTGSLVASYAYDTEGRRVERAVAGAGQFGGTLVTRTVFDGPRELMDIDGIISRRYVNADALDDRIMMEFGVYVPPDLIDAVIGTIDPHDPVTTAESVAEMVVIGPTLVPALGQRFYFHADHLGSVFGITNDLGLIVEAYSYSPYGQHVLIGDPLGVPLPSVSLAPATPGGTSAILNPFTYTGRAYDPETGFHQFRTRYYASDMGRFVSRDSIGVWGDPANYGNGYAYVGNRPHAMMDPMGEKGWKISVSLKWFGGGSAVIGHDDEVGWVGGVGSGVGWSLSASFTAWEGEFEDGCSVSGSGQVLEHGVEVEINNSDEGDGDLEGDGGPRHDTFGLGVEAGFECVYDI